MKWNLLFKLLISFLLLSLLFAYLMWFKPDLSAQASTAYQIEVAFPNLTFNQPVGVYSAGDGTNRLFVVEQPGVIRVFENAANTSLSNVFLDLTDRVLFSGEQGLLGLAFHPNYEANGYFYVNYVVGSPTRTIIARFSTMTSDPDRADPNSELSLLTVSQPFSNHKGGQLAFGADGYLYAALGDGGSGGDPFGNAQNRASLLGKILRIDVDSPSGERNYGIPADNPYAGNTLGYREEIYAYGLRNPWRFSFDPTTRLLWVGDVGQSQREEVDIVEKGKNYGWNIMEGSLCYSPSTGCNQTGLELPIWEYGHDEGVSVIGGFVYRGSAMPELYGAYVYGDYGSGKIWALWYNGTDAPVNTLLVDSTLNIASFGLDAQSELYISALDGKIYQFQTSDTTPPAIGAPSQVPQSPLPNEEVKVTVTITDASGVKNATLSYRSGAVWINISMMPEGDDVFSANITAMPEQTVVEYQISAYDNFDNLAVGDNQGLLYSYTVIPEFSSLGMCVVLIGATLLTAILMKKRKFTVSRFSAE